MPCNFTHTGYAFFANLDIDAIHDALGTNVPRIDLAAVLADDPGSPEALEAAGFHIGSCDR